MAITLRSLHEYTGTEVGGVDLAKPVSPEDATLLNQTLALRGLLVFHDQQLDAPGFAKAIEVFGGLMPQQIDRFCLEDYPIIGFISNRDTDAPGGKVIVRGEQYHTDHSNFEMPPKATALYGVSIPSIGGDTQFVNVQQAYDELPQAVKDRIDDLKCLHVVESSRSPRKLAKIGQNGAAIPKHALQPLVAVHSETGRKGLYLNTARMENIPGMEEEEAHNLIGELMSFATQPRFEYRHKWRKNDLVIWDNRTVMHQANGDVPPSEFRYLYRLMVQGDALQAA